MRSKGIKILAISALIFVASCLLEAIFWPSAYSFWLDNILFPFASAFALYMIFREKQWRLLVLLLVLLFFWGLISNIIADGNPRTYIPFLLRWLKWPVVLLSVFYGFPITGIRRKNMESIFRTVFLILVGINIWIVINPWGWGEALQFIYSPKIDVMIANYHEFNSMRLSGTMMNPNDNAGLFGIFFIFFLKDGLRANWKFLLSTIVIILLTQSRTVLISLFIITALYVSLQFFKTKKINLRWPTIGAFTAILLFLVFRFNNLDSIFSGQAFTSDSFLQRFSNFKIFAESSFSQKIFGSGIISDPFHTLGIYFDSEFLSILFQYGLIGFCLWLSIGLYVFISGIRMKKNWIWISGIVYLMLVSGTNLSLSNPNIAVLFFCLIGLCAHPLTYHIKDPAEEKAEKNKSQNV